VASYSWSVLVGAPWRAPNWQAEVSRVIEDNDDVRPQSAHGSPDTNACHRVTLEDLRRFADTFGDLADPAITKRAWRP
jgi:hypothetical protein